MSDYRNSILKRISELETERDNTPIWRIFKICSINYDIEKLGDLFKNDLKNG